RVVREIERHQRRERVGRQAGQRHGIENPLAILQRLFCRCDGRTEVRHHDGPLELSRGIGNDGVECFTIAQMQMPVVGADESQSLRRGLRHERFYREIWPSASGMLRSTSRTNIAQPAGMTASLKSKAALCRTQPDSAPPCPSLK